MRYPSVEKEIKFSNKILIVEARKTFKMYSFLQDLEAVLKRDLKKYQITTKGSWKKFD